MCPCKSDCPTGCPCPNYVCTEVTTEALTTTTISAKNKNSVLVLNTYYTPNVPIIIDSNGRQDRNFYFVRDVDTNAVHSCSIIWGNEMFVIGSSWGQVSKINGCRLERVGTLNFEHNLGACTTVLNTFIYLCFNSNEADYKRCRMARDPLGPYENITESVFTHKRIQIAASSSKSRMIFSSLKIKQRIYWPSDVSRRSIITAKCCKLPWVIGVLYTITLMIRRAIWYLFSNITMFTWKVPYFIHFYAVTFAANSFYIFGGSDGTDLTTIARLDSDTNIWSNVGSLNTGRQGHSVIYHNGTFLVVGGAGETKPTENCSMMNDAMTCTESTPSLKGYQFYPLLFSIEDDFCKTCDWKSISK